MRPQPPHGHGKGGLGRRNLHFSSRKSHPDDLGWLPRAWGARGVTLTRKSPLGRHLVVDDRNPAKLIVVMFEYKTIACQMHARPVTAYRSRSKRIEASDEKKNEQPVKPVKPLKPIPIIEDPDEMIEFFLNMDPDEYEPLPLGGPVEEIHKEHGIPIEDIKNRIDWSCYRLTESDVEETLRQSGLLAHPMIGESIPTKYLVVDDRDLVRPIIVMHEYRTINGRVHIRPFMAFISRVKHVKSLMKREEVKNEQPDKSLKPWPHLETPDEWYEFLTTMDPDEYEPLPPGVPLGELHRRMGVKPL